MYIKLSPGLPWAMHCCLCLVLLWWKLTDSSGNANTTKTNHSSLCRPDDNRVLPNPSLLLGPAVASAFVLLRRELRLKYPCWRRLSPPDRYPCNSDCCCCCPSFPTRRRSDNTTMGGSSFCILRSLCLACIWRGLEATSRKSNVAWVTIHHKTCPLPAAVLKFLLLYYNINVKLCVWSDCP